MSSSLIIKTCCSLFILSVGIILIAAGVLKLWDVVWNPFSDVISGYPKIILFTTGLIELSLGCCNLFARRSPTIWGFNCLLFLLMFVISTLRWFLGYHSCGCFGNIEIANWIPVVLDAFVLAGLILAGPIIMGLSFGQLLTSFRSDLISLSAKHLSKAGGFTLACLTVWVVQSNDLLSKDIIQSSRIDIGQVSLGEKRQIDINLHNGSMNCVEVVGTQSSCNCVNLSPDSRFVIGPKSNRVLPVSFSAAQLGVSHQRVICFLNSPYQREVAIELYAFVTTE